MKITIKTTTLLKNPTIHIESIETPTYTITPKVPIEVEYHEDWGDIWLYFKSGDEARIINIQWDKINNQFKGEITGYNFHHLINNI